MQEGEGGGSKAMKSDVASSSFLQHFFFSEREETLLPRFPFAPRSWREEKEKAALFHTKQFFFCGINLIYLLISLCRREDCAVSGVIALESNHLELIPISDGLIN